MKMKQERDSSNYSSNMIIRTLIILGIVAVLGVLFTVILYSSYVDYTRSRYVQDIIGYAELNTSVEIAAHSIGMNADIDSLKFGKTYPGGSGSRYFYINSTRSGTVHITATGEISRFLVIQKNDFAIRSNESERVDVEIDVPKGASLGKYYGVIQIEILKS
jgi:hypothetical protein